MNTAKHVNFVFEFVLTVLLLFAFTVPHALAEERIEL